MKRLLFLCTGNYYRSRFAEIYFNSKSIKPFSEWRAFSRGFDISNKENIGLISLHTINKLNELKISLPKIISSPIIVNEIDLLDSDKIIALNEAEHRPLIKKYFPFWESKTVFWHIHDLYEEYSSTSLNKLIFEINAMF